MGKNTKNGFGARIIGIVTATNRNEEDAWKALEKCDLVEFRGDLWAPDQIIPELISFREETIQRFGKAMETIFTLRLKIDGGAWPNDLAQDREKIWLRLGLNGPHPFCEWIDIEEENFSKLSPEMTSVLQSRRVKLLASHHNMLETYASRGLEELGHKLMQTQADGFKIAVHCQTRNQVLELIDFMRSFSQGPGRNPGSTCVLSMGGIGRATRVIAPLLGCTLTYGYLSGDAVAPGQLSVSEMSAFYDAARPEGWHNLSNSDLLDWAEALIPGDSFAK